MRRAYSFVYTHIHKTDDKQGVKKEEEEGGKGQEEGGKKETKEESSWFFGFWQSLTV